MKLQSILYSLELNTVSAILREHTNYALKAEKFCKIYFNAANKKLGVFEKKTIFL